MKDKRRGWRRAAVLPAALLLLGAGARAEDVGKKIERDAKQIVPGTAKAGKKAGKSASEIGKGTAKALEKLRKQLGGGKD